MLLITEKIADNEKDAQTDDSIVLNTLLAGFEPKSAHIIQASNPPDLFQAYIRISREIWLFYFDCNKVFKTKLERGLHINAAHKDWRTVGFWATSPNIKKTKWTTEEKHLLSRRKAVLTLKASGSGVMVINQALTPFFSDRTVEAIRDVPRRPEHQALISKIINEITKNINDNAENTPPTSDLVAMKLPIIQNR
ncbi:hypothetical protein GWI33_005158 [Rhynchophorus ferrugineus]|uniref:Uncharacterized protein n=1 Tax=Rhynchophorus ferrugineus TaxID=354439 RepID=A0A834MI85_RHYFE|nr:hypothetical protein GWI33_005158 [Rhynchophorus ferrugineus]